MVVTLFKLIFPSIHNPNCATWKLFGRIWTTMLLPLKIYTSWKLFRPTKRATCRCLGPLSKMKLKSTQCISIIYCTKLKHPFLLAFKILFRTYTLPFRLLHQLFTNEIPTKKKIHRWNLYTSSFRSGKLHICSTLQKSTPAGSERILQSVWQSSHCYTRQDRLGCNIPYRHNILGKKSAVERVEYAGWGGGQDDGPEGGSL